MYPHCCRQGTFPTGKGQIISYGDFMANKIKLSQIFGPITCSVYPPTDTLFPVLGVKMHSRLMFPLCYTCAKNLNPNRCTCSDSERMLTGTWTHVELARALSTGYRLAHFFEALHFDENNRTEGGQGSLFYSYMNQFYFLKQTNSGWPDWCKTEEQKELYLHKLSNELGLKVTASDIHRNESIRFLAKLCLNSLSIVHCLFTNKLKTYKK